MNINQNYGLGSTTYDSRIFILAKRYYRRLFVLLRVRCIIPITNSPVAGGLKPKATKNLAYSIDKTDQYKQLNFNHNPGLLLKSALLILKTQFQMLINIDQVSNSVCLCDEFVCRRQF